MLLPEISLPREPTLPVEHGSDLPVRAEHRRPAIELETLERRPPPAWRTGLGHLEPSVAAAFSVDGEAGGLILLV